MNPGALSTPPDGYRVAMFRGRSALSVAIKFFTRGDYSHAAWWNDGEVVEAWHRGGVQKRIAAEGHRDGTPVDLFTVQGMTPAQAAAIQAFHEAQVGTPYDFRGVLKFISRRRAQFDDKWFCSELVLDACRQNGVELLARVPAWHVSPAELSHSPLLVYERTVYLEKPRRTRILKPEGPRAAWAPLNSIRPTLTPA